MSSRSAAALHRSYGPERALVGIVGTILLLGGALVLVLGQGVLGEFRSERHLADPQVVDWLHRYPTLIKTAAIVLGILLVIFGLAWFTRGLRPEAKPNLRLTDEQHQHTTVVSGAIANAIESDCESLDGINKARARSVGSTSSPALRLQLWLDEGTDVRDVWEKLNTHVLCRARQCLGVENLPTAVRLEIDNGAPAPRVQ